MDVVGFFFVGVFAEGVDGLAAVEFAVIDILGRAHDGDVQLTMTGADVIPVDEVDVCELAASRTPSLMVMVSLRPKNTERRWPSVFMLV